MKGILFRPEMIQAVVNGSKSQTRRVIKPQPILETMPSPGGTVATSLGYFWNGHYIGHIENLNDYARCHVGETVYVKEAWATEKRYDHLSPSEIPHIAKIFYVSDGVGEWPTNLSIGKLRSSLFMPEWAARYFITITDVRAERLQERPLEDALAEGFTEDEWRANLWIFAYTFKQERRR